MKSFLNKHMLIIKYLFFGIGTTVLGWGIYFGILLCGRTMAGLDIHDTTSTQYLAVYTIAQLTQWVITVVFAFFTNRKWVFTDHDEGTSTPKQLTVFASGRVLTLVMDYVVTFFGAYILCQVLPMLNSLPLFGREWNINEIAAKLISAILVIIGNYFFSKKLVFGKKGTK